MLLLLSSSNKYWRNFKISIVDLTFYSGFAGERKEACDTFSATDVRGCSVSQLQAWLSINVVEFKQRVTARSSTEYNITDDPGSTTVRKLVTCYEKTNLGEVIDEQCESMCIECG